MARKMLKRVKLIPKKLHPDAIEGEFKVVPPPAVPLLALPPAPPPEPSDLLKRMDAAKARIQAKRPDLTNYVKVTPPIEASELAGETVVAGKSVADWAALIAERCEDGGVIDLTDLPSWVSWAVDVWKRKGSPTAASIYATKVVALRADAEKATDTAAGLERCAVVERSRGEHGKAERLLKDAEKAKRKADEKWAEAKKLSDEWEANK